MGGLFGDPWSPGNRVEPNLLRVPPTEAEAQLWSSGGSSPALGAHKWMFSIIDLPLADPSEPLVRWRLQQDTNLQGSGPGSADAGVGATGTPAFRIRKNGGANGTIDFAGTTGTFNLVDPDYADGDLFELLPPVTTDATLDRVSITFETD